MGDEGSLKKYAQILARVGLGDFTEDEIRKLVPEIQKQNDRVKRTIAPNSFLPLDLDEALRHAGKGSFSMGKDSPSYKISGSVKPGFERVKEAFEKNFRRGLERDAQLAIYHKGTLVVDLWGSNTEPNASMAPPGGYDAATLQIIYSSSKAITSCVVAFAADQGWLAFADHIGTGAHGLMQKRYLKIHR